MCMVHWFFFKYRDQLFNETYGNLFKDKNKNRKSKFLNKQDNDPEFSEHWQWHSIIYKLIKEGVVNNANDAYEMNTNW